MKNNPGTAYDAAVAWCKANGVVLVPVVEEEGDEDASRAVTFAFDWDESDAVQSYLTVVKSVGSRIIYATVQRLESEDLDDALEEAAELEVPADRARIEAEIRGLRASVGSIAHLRLQTVMDAASTRLSFNMAADWYDIVFDRDGWGDAPPEEPEIERPPREELIRLSRKLAQELSAQADFYKAKSVADRCFLAKKLLAATEHGDYLSHREVADEAHAIFRMEVMPALVKRLNELVADGVKDKNLAQKLGISDGLLQKLMKASS